MSQLTSQSAINPFLKFILKNILLGIYKKNHPTQRESSLFASKKIETINISTPDTPTEFPSTEQNIKTQVQETPQTPKITPKKFHISGTPIPSQHYNLEKLNLLISDKHVYSIECPGPGKPLRIKSLGLSRESKIILTEKEIKAVIEKFSSETKIPTINGIFKATLNNLIVTAIISEKVGSRFLITKQRQQH